MNLVIRSAAPDDLPALLEIERASFSRPHWQSDDFLPNECTVVELNGSVVAFLVSRETFQGSEHELAEREILNLAVAPSFRRKGIAKTLLRHELRRRAAYFLEVRESNMAAQNLYFQFGFREIARRPRYYQDPSEGAIVMQMKKC